MEDTLGLMKIERIDHVVLTVKNMEVSCRFYSQVLGLKVVHFAQDRKGLAFGTQRINLHEAGKEFEPKALNPTPGSSDLCFITPLGIEEVLAHLDKLGVPIIQGPVARTGATGTLQSVYIRDPDGNLIEIGTYKTE